MDEIDKFGKLLRYFVAHLEFAQSQQNKGRFHSEFQMLLGRKDFKKTGQGYNGDKIQSLIKIGFAENIDNRISQYKACNPGIEFISKREGSLELEKNLHNVLHRFGFNRYKDEWYLNISL